MPEAKKLLQGILATSNFHRERDILIDQLRSYIDTLRSSAPLKDNHLCSITLDIRSLGLQAKKLKWASEALVVDEGNMPYVLTKGTLFFTKTLPDCCDQLGLSADRIFFLLASHSAKPIPGVEATVAHDLETLLLAITNLTK
jgi:hypothetical protein